MEDYKRSIEKDRKYFFTFCEKYVRFFPNEQCLLIAYNDEERGTMLGYALETDGFPKAGGPRPIFKQEVRMSSVVNIWREEEDLLFQIDTG